MQHDLYERFRTPPNTFRGKPLWSWNGELDRDQLLKQIHAFKEMGFGGFYMHSRVGLKTEYLGEEWMALTRECAEEAKRLGMEAWLYDEDRWPSGTAGGRVTEEPRYRLKFMKADPIATDAFEWTEAVVAAFHCRMEGINIRHCVQLKKGFTEQLPQDGMVLVFTVTEMQTSSFYNGSTYLDTLNREATDRFLALTHDKYNEACGDLFGSHIQGIFTDEPHRGSLLDGFGILNPDKERHVPWTYDLFDRFRSAFGYDLIPHLPELFYRLDGNVVSQVKWHYVELLQMMFLDNFAVPMQDWCRKHGLRLTGHVLHEDSLTAQTAMSGSVMRYYEYMDDPGIDVLTEANRCYWIAKQLSSVARQFGKKWLFSELYGATGWQMSFQGHKAVGDWQALFGINARSHHLAWYSMEGEAKRDFPGTIGPQCSWWQEYEKVETYFSRMAVAMSEGNAVCDVLVLNPVESVWCQVYSGWSSMLVPKSPEVIEVERQYKDLFQWLSSSQIDFDYGDEHHLSRYGSVEVNDSGEPELRIGESTYRVVIVAGMLTIRTSTLQLLDAFLQAGGRVVVAGTAPTYVDALPSQAARHTLGRTLAVEWSEAAVVDACSTSLRVLAEATDSGTDEPVRDIYCQIRMVDGGYLVMFQNTDRSHWLRNVRLRLKNIRGIAEQWNVLTGERVRVPAVETVEGLELLAEFPPSGEQLYFVRALPDDAVPLQESFEETVAGDWTGPFAYRLSESNVCVLDRAAYRIDDGDWQDEDDILKVDRAVRDHFKVEWRNNKMIQPWYALANGEWPSEPLGRISLAFRFHLDSFTTDRHWHLAMEHPERFTLFVNDVPLPNVPVPGEWVDPCFRLLPLPASMLREGENRIVLETAFHERVDLEVVYILGDFGVKLKSTEKQIVALPERMGIGDLAEQGLPFYGGMIAFQLDADERRLWGDENGNTDVHLLRLQAINGACAKVVYGNGEAQSMPWMPYEANITLPMLSKDQFELQLFLSRRNTFGPLHMKPAQSNAYSPEHFHTTGDRYCDAYELWPAGIPMPPQHIVRRRVSQSTRT
ncbi:glycosyl hydrolase [Paenibacillus koleovorans]|uniref:glycosyl hydrolase n=1 Tax=Paenibacillus koleovorans TaxID=121608 RepID=UPI000FD9DE9C|nr:glycosyl hydrolase [Paenibacillus koleovorans]